jgi:hypothetical protein
MSFEPCRVDDVDDQVRIVEHPDNNFFSNRGRGGEGVSPGGINNTGDGISEPSAAFRKCDGGPGVVGGQNAAPLSLTG